MNDIHVGLSWKFKVLCMYSHNADKEIRSRCQARTFTCYDDNYANAGADYSEPAS